MANKAACDSDKNI